MKRRDFMALLEQRIEDATNRLLDTKQRRS
jgi:hypothetical protein